MPTLADVVRRYAPAYLQRFGETIPPEHRKVLDAVAACRTGDLGYVLFGCASCGGKHEVPRSCGNRHCPTCQQDKSEAWLKKQTERLLPCPYFLLTFTLPEELRRFVRSQQRVGYGALFRASSQAIKRLAADPRYVGTRTPGFVGVLHTWGRTLQYHPHVHYVVAGGGPSDDGSHWMASRADFFVPVRALSKLFRAGFREALREAGLLPQVNPAVWKKDWVVHSLPVGDGRSALKYLAPYVFRVALSNARILSCQDGQVCFSYRKSGSRRPRTMRLEAREFLRRFLQHVLPRGFPKVRAYGFLSGRAKPSLEWLRWLLALQRGEPFVLRGQTRASSPPEAAPLGCPNCGAPLSWLGVLKANGRTLFQSRAPP